MYAYLVLPIHWYHRLLLGLTQPINVFESGYMRTVVLGLYGTGYHKRRDRYGFTIEHEHPRVVLHRCLIIGR